MRDLEVLWMRSLWNLMLGGRSSLGVMLVGRTKGGAFEVAIGGTMMKGEV